MWIGVIGTAYTRLNHIKKSPRRARLASVGQAVSIVVASGYRGEDDFRQLSERLLERWDDGLYADTTLVSRFDAPDGRTRFMVVNLDYTKERTIHIAAPAQLERFDALPSIWSPVGAAETNLALPKGGSFLLRFAEASPR